MIGIDITKINRFNDFSENKVKRILHPQEIKLYLESKNKPKFLATRWAIKEALYKIDNSLFHFDKILIQNKNCKYVFKDYNISTSSEDNYLIAIVQKEKKW